MSVKTRPLPVNTATANRTATLVAATDEARETLGGRTGIPLTSFPFKVGRESRLTTFAKLKSELERRLNRAAQLNDLYLVERPSEEGRLHISREHFAIERVEDG